MSTPDIVDAITPIADAFEELGVPYLVAGSVASSAYGIARATLDVDLVADLATAHVDPLVRAISSAYYVDFDAAMDAVNRRAMFNVVHLATMLKVDIYILTARAFDQESFRRRRQAALEESDHPRLFSLDTAEDTVLHKLEWYRAGGEVSERQWGDVVGVLAVQSGALDMQYLREWARELGVDDLLERALRDAGASHG
jgi:hypothetical protein